MDNLRLRAILLNLQDRLSNDDRKRLHFYFGNDIPRRIRDDPSLGGTLNLMDSLFDQDKINDEDFTYLINAFDQIRCLDAVKLTFKSKGYDADEDDDGQQMVSSCNSCYQTKSS
ncbi:hypothetical protein I4U23_004710 [Adineta vaga]|nr:hypothetical protein I4U23_004710 [Adineta vaga]